MPLTYTDEDAIRTTIGVDDEVLDDDAAETLGVQAEDVIDEMLGAGWPDEDTGRKIVEADVDDWQWEKLGRATAAAAKFLYQHPDWLSEQRYSSVGGDVSGAQRVGSPMPEVSIILNQSGLRRLTGTAL